jgi:DNA repair photolyase
MSLKKSAGNMYPWVTHTHSHLGGECPHHCSYCYVNNPRFGRPAKYTGPIRLLEDEFKVNYGTGKTIFIEHCNDLFAEAVPNWMIERILEHCRRWPDNTYVFQTKNPLRALDHEFPAQSILGVTIETNRTYILRNISHAPPPRQRANALSWTSLKKFVTIEPILDFDVDELVRLIQFARPDFVNIGADSKGRGLPEPSGDKVRALLAALKKSGIKVREKHNLERLLNRKSQIANRKS